MAATLRSPLPLACSSSSSAAFPGNGNASKSSGGVLGGAICQFPVAMSVVPVYSLQSRFFVRNAAVCAGKGEGLGGLVGRKWQLGKSSIAVQPRLVRGTKNFRTAHANYGIKEYGTPLPPYVDAPRQSSKTDAKIPSSGQGELKKFWDYGAPESLRPYTNPNSYGAPRNYGIPAYSAQSAVVTADTLEASQIEDVVVIAEAREPEPELGGGDGGPGKDGGRGGGGGGGDGSGEGEESEPHKPISMSQKLTLVYAVLVGAGGLMGFVKSGSNKSLISGGGAALALFLVFTQLPSNPTLASSFGLGISAVLLGIMYPRFKKSGKFMPAGLVSLVSLVMTAGYLHGIVRTAH